MIFRFFLISCRLFLSGAGDPDCLFSLMLWHEEELGTSEDWVIRTTYIITTPLRLLFRGGTYQNVSYIFWDTP